MNMYTCQIDLKQEAKALAFAGAIADWMEFLMDRGTIRNWRLMRRKLNLASDNHRDFLLEVEVDDLAQLDSAFRLTGQKDERIEQLHRAVHDLIASADFGLYRPFPDEERAERMALL
ncbi:hypothetical protein E4Z66_03830 [Aliishimia ponticola]|uniref:Uncharacterized protein n=1 Tax=Aliishimia ponticola TaxID=2499833 RepID=A0A4S4NLJ3_9RHOB|nr:DUF6614 family protein [Aliishimia ponticola]THH39201.1 hypothetical protein E4Z66_03830 [Aliishimia ponticola]